MSSPIFAALPGVETPVDQVRRALAAVWDLDVATDEGAPSGFRASQMNLVMHFGLESTPEGARESFETALRFAHRYPCRIIALCPQAKGAGRDVAAKIFCECYIGQSHREMTCIEAVVLGYPLTHRRHLENQASILLESDLPLYFWLQHVQEPARIADYTFFLGEANRVIVDSAIEKPGLIKMKWPKPERVSDLTLARTLPVRQSIGHFLSNIPPDEITAGLKRVEVRHRAAWAAEAKVLLAWVRERTLDCRPKTKAASDKPAFACRRDAKQPESLVIEWSYADNREICLTFDFERKHAELRHRLDGSSNTLSSTTRLLPPENALAEAVFF